MKFNDILKELVCGKKIRRKHWYKNYFLTLGLKNFIVDCFGKPFQFKTTSFSGRDWEVFEEKKPKEKGVWIVYDLEANREIQNLLQEKKFAFRIDPSLEILKQLIFAEVYKGIDEIKDWRGYPPEIIKKNLGINQNASGRKRE